MKLRSRLHCQKGGYMRITNIGILNLINFDGDQVVKTTLNKLTRSIVFTLSSARYLVADVWCELGEGYFKIIN